VYRAVFERASPAWEPFQPGEWRCQADPSAAVAGSGMGCWGLWPSRRGSRRCSGPVWWCLPGLARLRIEPFLRTGQRSRRTEVQGLAEPNPRVIWPCVPVWPQRWRPRVLFPRSSPRVPGAEPASPSEADAGAISSESVRALPSWCPGKSR